YLDHAPPTQTAATLIARARARDWRWMARAAAILVVVGSVSGVAWGAPGSHPRALVREAPPRLRSPPPARPPPPPPPPPPPAPRRGSRRRPRVSPLPEAPGC